MVHHPPGGCPRVPRVPRGPKVHFDMRNALCTATMAEDQRFFPAFLSRARPLGSLPRAVVGMSVRASRREGVHRHRTPLLPVSSGYAKAAGFPELVRVCGAGRCNVQLVKYFPLGFDRCASGDMHWNVIFALGWSSAVRRARSGLGERDDYAWL
jgi:hypothetical protein